MPTAYIHIGQHKTGSTAIQEFLFKNRTTLYKKGFIYVHFPKIVPSHPLAWYYGFGNRVATPDENARTDRRISGFIKDAINSNRNIIISSEILFSNQNLDKVRRLADRFKEFDLKVICYLRRQDSYAESYYNQMVKFGRTFEIEAFLKEFNLNWYQQVQIYAEVVGKENLIIRPFERSLFEKGNVVLDFINLIGLNEPDAFRFPVKKMNESYPRDVLEILKLINTVKPPVEKKPGEKIDPFVRFFDSYIDAASPIRKDKLLLTQSQRASIMKKYGSSNRKIATELMEKSDGILFSDSTEIKASTRKYSFEPEDSIPLIFDILRRQYREIKYLKQRMNEMLAEKKEKEG